MQREKLESAAADCRHLRGLFGIPLGCLIVLSALGNWQWGPVEDERVFLAGALLLAASCLPISRFYDAHYGRVTLSRRQQAHVTVATIVCAPLVFGLSMLARSNADWSLDLPVNTVAASLGLAMLITYASTAGLRAHRVIAGGGLFVIGALPVWTGADPSNVGLVLAGVATAAAGILDHVLLVRTFGPAGGLNLADGDAGA
jgi:hypothetical protein